MGTNVYSSLLLTLLYSTYRSSFLPSVLSTPISFILLSPITMPLHQIIWNCLWVLQLIKWVEVTTCIQEHYARCNLQRHSIETTIVAYIFTFISRVPNSDSVYTNSLAWGEWQGKIRQSPDNPIRAHKQHIA